MVDEKDDRLSFGFAPGALDMLYQAKRNECNEEYSVYLNGDLYQMSAQARFLKSFGGIDVKFNNVYPCVRPCDKEKTFKLMWKYKCEGWWHYENEYVELKLCTNEEFKTIFNKWYDDKKDEEKRNSS